MIRFVLLDTFAFGIYPLFVCVFVRNCLFVHFNFLVRHPSAATWGRRFETQKIVGKIKGRREGEISSMTSTSAAGAFMTRANPHGTALRKMTISDYQLIKVLSQDSFGKVILVRRKVWKAA